MSCVRQIIFTLAALATVQIHAQNLPSISPEKPHAADSAPPLPTPASPVAQFRELLGMTPAERAHFLTNRPAATRARILAKLREYQALNPDERELRLRATELRWYLTPLLRATPAEREARLAQVPADLRGIVSSRLDQWAILPPALQNELLASDQAVHYFAHVGATNTVTTPEQQRIAEQFNAFFDFGTEEKKQVLGTLSETERKQMETALQNFDQLPADQRRMCVKNFTKFAGMSPAQQAEFLKNAEQWSKMTPQERKSWRDLVANVPDWPPFPAPTGSSNSALNGAPKFSRPGVATN